MPAEQGDNKAGNCRPQRRCQCNGNPHHSHHHPALIDRENEQCGTHHHRQYHPGTDGLNNPPQKQYRKTGGQCGNQTTGERHTQRREDQYPGIKPAHQKRRHRHKHRQGQQIAGHQPLCLTGGERELAHQIGERHI